MNSLWNTTDTIDNGSCLHIIHRQLCIYARSTLNNPWRWTSSGNTKDLLIHRPRNQRFPQICSDTGRFRFPLNGFKYYCTLFSKFFASFPHGTCSLSVSLYVFSLGWFITPTKLRLYYQTTRLHNKIYRNAACIQKKEINGILTLHDIPFQEICSFLAADISCLFSNTSPLFAVEKEDSHSGLFPLRSPLLGEFQLVSFPPLNDMLKFSGYPRLIGGLGNKKKCMMSSDVIQRWGKDCVKRKEKAICSMRWWRWSSCQSDTYSLSNGHLHLQNSVMTTTTTQSVHLCGWYLHLTTWHA